MTNKPDYGEFSDARQAALYDAHNPLGVDGDFFCREAAELSPSLIVDLGCGTGLLTCELAKRGYNLIGVDPAGAMLTVARTKPYADKVRWIQGSYEKLAGLKADLILMTSHVAQFFLEEDDWQAMLKAAHGALLPGGHLIFDSRNPLARPWENWWRASSMKAIGQTQRWFQLAQVDGNRVRYEVHYLLATGEELVSTNELIYRSQEAITESLENAGFAIEHIYGDWNKEPTTSHSPEMVFDAIPVPAR